MSASAAADGGIWLLGSSLLFTLTNLLLLPHLLPKSASSTSSQRWQWKNTFNSLIHSTVTGIWAVLCFFENPKMAEDMVGSYTYFAHALISVSLGYFIYDFLDMMLRHRNRNSYELGVHHLFVFLAFLIPVCSGKYTNFAVVSLLVEINSVFLHIRELLQICGLSRDDFFYRLNSLFNIGTFVLFRLLSLAWMVQWLATADRSLMQLFPDYLIACAGLSVIFPMSIVLFYRVLQDDYLSKEPSGSLPPDLQAGADSTSGETAIRSPNDEIDLHRRRTSAEKLASGFQANSKIQLLAGNIETLLGPGEIDRNKAD